MRIWVIASSMLMFLLTSSACQAAELIGIDAKYPPYMHGTKKVPQGIYYEILKEVSAKIGVPFTIQALPWKRVLSNIDEGKAGGAGLYMNKDRLKKYDFSSPMFSENVVVYVAKKSALKIEKFEDLKGLKVGVVKGWSYGDNVIRARKENWFVAKEAPTNESNIKKLAAGRVDVILGIPESTARIAKEHGIDGQIEIRGPVIEQNGAYITFLKTQNKTELINKINTALEELKQEGKIQQIVQNILAAE